MLEDLTLRPITEYQIESIRKWRNSQIPVGESRPVLEILDYLRDIFPNIKVISGVSTGELESSQANLEILQKVASWRPEYSIRGGIQEIVDYELSKK